MHFLWLAAISSTAALLRSQRSPTRRVQALRAPSRLPPLRALRVDGLLDAADLARKRATHECLKALAATGALAAANLAEDAVVVSQYGDPLATGAADAAQLTTFFARAATELDAPVASPVNATQTWRVASGPLALGGATKVEFDEAGLARRLELSIETLNGNAVEEGTASLATARAALVALLGGASSSSYKQLAGFGQRALAATLGLVSPGSAGAAAAAETEADAAPDAEALGRPGFDAYLRFDEGARRAVASLEQALDGGGG
eukprot:CAMPEP_0119284476 /NCGR_PEP_ID=MMETSP1329-20130426/30375_1 /TAXON_ID=114041 /ORGANISM="Genus nov. species nov., Strain RCC1024" /LENGTH=262 /DNA_ID=CAMNT_0007285155 /DNA_START=117 /DNA_END=901 /DNA_ORIENTATION=+